MNFIVTGVNKLDYPRYLNVTNMQKKSRRRKKKKKLGIGKILFHGRERETKSFVTYSVCP